MVIISHKHQFIFIKTMKTASTSMEIALSRFCGPHDVLTSFGPDDEAFRRQLGFRSAQNCRLPIGKWSAEDFVRFLVRRVRPNQFNNHSPASLVRSVVGEKIWNGYHTFTIVRNPWDRAISHYFFRYRQVPEGERPSLHDALLSYPTMIERNWKLYTDRDKIIVDQVLRYEDLRAGLQDLGRRLGLDDELALTFESVRAKTSTRPRDTRPEEFLDARDIHLIGLLAEREIESFGYKPPGAEKAEPPAALAT